MSAHNSLKLGCKVCGPQGGGGRGGGNLTHNGDPRVGKLIFENLKMSNFPWVAPLLPHPGANITQDSIDL